MHVWLCTFETGTPWVNDLLIHGPKAFSCIIPKEKVFLHGCRSWQSNMLSINDQHCWSVSIIIIILFKFLRGGNKKWSDTDHFSIINTNLTVRNPSDHECLFLAIMVLLKKKIFHLYFLEYKNQQLKFIFEWTDPKRPICIFIFCIMSLQNSNIVFAYHFVFHCAFVRRDTINSKIKSK